MTVPSWHVKFVRWRQHSGETSGAVSWIANHAAAQNLRLCYHFSHGRACPLLRESVPPQSIPLACFVEKIARVFFFRPIIRWLSTSDLFPRAVHSMWSGSSFLGSSGSSPNCRAFSAAFWLDAPEREINLLYYTLCCACCRWHMYYRTVYFFSTCIAGMWVFGAPVVGWDVPKTVHGVLIIAIGVW